MNTQNDLLMIKINKFYEKEENINKFLSVIDPNRGPVCSLRLIEWFVTNYCKKYNILTKKIVENETIYFNIYTDYKAQLKAYSKKFFDPFKRRERILFKYNNDKEIETTIGQLNIFKWIIENNILSYILENIEDISDQMNKNYICNCNKKEI